MFNSKYSKFLTVLLIIAIIAIVVLLVFIGHNLYDTYSVEKKNASAANEFEEIVREDIETVENYTETTVENNDVQDIPNENNPDQSNSSNPFDGVSNTGVSSGSGSSSSSSKKTKNVTLEGYNVIGTIEIPATNIKYSIVDKVTKRSIEIAIALVYPVSAPEGEELLNQRRNTTLIGHNYRNGTFFSNNKKLKTGDVIYITDKSGKKVTYVIYDTKVLAESDSTYINRNTGGVRELSLSTCTEDASTRLVIFAREK